MKLLKLKIPWGDSAIVFANSCHKMKKSEFWIHSIHHIVTLDNGSVAQLHSNIKGMLLSYGYHHCPQVSFYKLCTICQLFKQIHKTISWYANSSEIKATERRTYMSKVKSEPFVWLSTPKLSAPWAPSWLPAAHLAELLCSNQLMSAAVLMKDNFPVPATSVKPEINYGIKYSSVTLHWFTANTFNFCH